MAIKGRRTSSKNPPILSHEFVIQNHADIVSCVAMVFVVGLMFQVTFPLASMFVAVQHNATNPETFTDVTDVMYYTNGLKDICCVFFYTLICVVVHGVIQEYVLDKVTRKLHFSKLKHSKFNESGQLIVFYALSCIWGIDLIIRENYFLHISSLWEDYPHSSMIFLMKFFFLIQMSYWLHCYPEIYFQKTKKEEAWGRVQYATLYFVCISLAYTLNFNRIALCLLIPHYFVEIIYHIARLLHFIEKPTFAKKGFQFFNVMFMVVRLISIILSVLTFWYGLSLSGSPNVDLTTGNFNTQIIRIGSLATVLLLQGWMMFRFISFHLHRRSEFLAQQQPGKKKSERSKKQKKHGDYDVNDLPEADQNLSKKNTRSRNVQSPEKKKK